jgi:hypothetical protein
MDIKCDRKLKCVRVEYDPAYWGGDYSGVGQFIHVPHVLVDRCPMDSKEGDGDDDDRRLRTAFGLLTGLAWCHVIHYTWDDVYDQDGSEWKEEG